MNKSKGITLVALAITIIILLILAGITISSLTGENGLISKIIQAKDKYSISEAREKLELEIELLRIEEEGKGERLEKEALPRLNNDKTDVGNVEHFPVEIIYDGYKFNVDENFIVTYIGEADKTIVTYITDPEGYTNKNEVRILIKAENPDGIKTIEYPDGDKLICNGRQEVGIDYKVNKNGTYTFKIVDLDGKEVIKDIVIDNIDTVEPKEFTPKVEDITIDGFTLIGNAKDGDETEESSQSCIGRYEYYIKKTTDKDYTKYETTDEKYIITGLEKGITYDIYVIAYDRAENKKQSTNVKETTIEDVLPPVAKIKFDETNLTEKILDYPILTLDGMKNCELVPELGQSVTLEIISKHTKTMKYMYSFDGGNSWNEYTGEVNTTYQADNMIQVKTIYKSGEVELESIAYSVKKYVYNSSKICLNTRALANESYDRDFATKSSIVQSVNKWITISPECWGRYINIYSYTEILNNYGTLNFYNYDQSERVGPGWLNNCGADLSIACSRSFKIPIDSYWGILSCGTSSFKANLLIYEVWCSDNNLSGNTYSNDNKPWSE